MTEMFYRVHWVRSPEFSADNAWSALWGAERVAGDPSRTICRECDGRKVDSFGEPCSTCGGEGSEEAVLGYSCCRTATELRDYFGQHGAPRPDDEVIIFEGYLAGIGLDGEPLAVPTRVVHRTTWAEFAGSAV